jgi:hypothetical protein
MWDGTTLSIKAPQTTALANNAVSYVELDPATGDISDNTVGFTADKLPLFQVTTAGGSVTAVLDRRAPYGFGGGSGGGGGIGAELKVRATGGVFAGAGTLAGWTETVDVDNAFNPTTGVFTTPATGCYLFSSSGQPSGGSPSFGYRINGGANVPVALANTTIGNLTAVFPLELTAGDTVELRSFGTVTNFANTTLSVLALGSGGGGGSGTSNAPLCHMWAFGDLTDPSAYGIDLDYFKAKDAGVITQVTTGIDQTPGAGNVVIDVFKNGVSIFPTVTKPTVACTGARSFDDRTGVELETVSFVAGDVFTFRLVSAPSGARTVTVDIYASS